MRTAVLLALLISAAAMSACVRDGGPRRSPPPGFSHAQPSHLVLLADNFADTNSNGYRDTATLVVYLMPRPSQSEVPMEAAGSFTFQLFGPDDSQIAEWRFDAAQTAAAMRQLAPGPGYIFKLSLLELGSDRLGATTAEPVAIFTPSRGEEVRARASAPVLIGPVHRR